MLDKKESVEVACRLAYDCIDVGWDHIDDTLSIYDSAPPCDGQELYNLTSKAITLKLSGKSFSEATKQLMLD